MYLESKKEYATKFNCIEDYVCLNKQQNVQLRNLLKLLEDGAIKYPRLIHVVLEWPFLSLMPKPPRDLLGYCEPEEYEFMLKRCKRPTVRDSVFSTPEIQSAAWLVYPKGESWVKESGIKRFNDLSFDISRMLGCNWKVLLHCYGLTKSYDHHFLDDGWDGLFDEDYHSYSHEGFDNGLYNCYYTTDVFYESIRLCNYLLNSVETEAEPQTVIEGELLPNADTAHSADFSSVRWHGETYSFTPTQKSAVKLLWQAWKNRTPDLGQDYILEEIGSDSTRLRDLFKGHPAWNKMIVSIKLSSFRLAEPEKN